MGAEVTGEVTDLLLAWNGGDAPARAALVTALYPDLKAIASRALSGEQPTQSLQPTALVNEVYLKLIDVNRIDWQGRSHFLGLAGHLMRQVLIDHARRRRASKRDWGKRITLTGGALAQDLDDIDLLNLDEALIELTRIDEQLARVVELRFFGGLTVDETAGVLEVSAPTVKRRWRAARAWLVDRLSDGVDD